MGLPLSPRNVRAESEARARLLRSAIASRRPTRGPRRTVLRPQDPYSPAPRRLGRHLAPGRSDGGVEFLAGGRVHLILRARRIPRLFGNQRLRTGGTAP